MDSSRVTPLNAGLRKVVDNQSLAEPTGAVDMLQTLRDQFEAELHEKAMPAPADRRGRLRPSRLAATRLRMRAHTLAWAFQTLDLIAVAGLAGACLSVAAPMGVLALPLGSALPYLVPPILLAVCLKTVGAYSLSPTGGLFERLGRVASACGLTALACAVAWTLLGPAGPAPAPLQTLIVAPFAVLGALHLVWQGLLRHYRKAGRLTPNLVIVGANKNAEAVIEAAAKSGGASVLGIFDDRLDRAPRQVAGVPVLGDTADLIGHRIMPAVDRVVITVSAAAQDRVRGLIERLGVLPNQVSLLIDSGDETARAAAISRIVGAPLAEASQEQASERRILAKRAQDLIVGSIALVCALPVMAIVAVAVKLDSPGPLFFRQRRHGFNNEEIKVWKFRSMRHEAADHTASRQISTDDDRVTRVGRVIRMTSLDELPQLINVLKGEMSLVGPRPHAVGMKTGETQSAQLVAEYAHRHRMKPGMTGWAAIRGSRGPVDTPESVRQRVALDIEYIERQSFWLDLRIIAMTIPCLLGDRSAVR